MNPAKFVKKLKITSNSLILLKKDSWAAQNMEQITEALKRTTLENVIVAIVDDLDTVRSLPQIEMQRYGWYRIEFLRDKILKKQIESKKVEEVKPDGNDPKPEEQKQ